MSYLRNMIVFVSLAVVLGAACATTMPSELVDARNAVRDSQQGVASIEAPAELLSAAQDLARAEKLFLDKGNSSETRDMAYLARRRAEIATAVALQRAEGRSVVDAEKQRDEIADELRKRTAKELTQTKVKLTKEQEVADAEREKRYNAEADASRADEALREYARITEEERGLVITVSSGVMFSSGGSKLLAAAFPKLEKVATHLSTFPGRAIRIEGHTDSNGSDSSNQRLSSARAEAVRTFILSRGIATQQVTAEGFGERRPIATNGTSEGRANNRRVEIVLAPLLIGAP